MCEKVGASMINRIIGLAREVLGVESIVANIKKAKL
jgi:small neutral amino acid transporter SnatA (MarC family)